MKALILFFLGCMLSLSSVAQNISVTFTGKGAATTIDSVTATNLRTNQKVTLPGNETLVLADNTGIPLNSEINDNGMVYPNPFSGKAIFMTSIPKAQKVYLGIQNMFGQVVAETQALVQQGENEFSFSVRNPGIYIVSITTEKGTASYKVISSEIDERENRIQYNGTRSDHYRFSESSPLKNYQTGNVLGYRRGDVIHYRCMSGVYSTIITDSPVTSRSYEVKFSVCTDPSGKTYSTVSIAAQTWMAENLSYLPLVSPSSAGSEATPYCYVYSYEGDIISTAKANASYAVYGVLYNWEAAKMACPTGWHLPSDGEWTALTDSLIKKRYGYEGSGNDIAKSMASTSGWDINSTSGTVGSDQASNNSSGFSAFPSGFRGSNGGFGGLGSYAFFWSATEISTSDAWKRILVYDGDVLYRGQDLKSYGFSVRCLQN